MEAQLKALKSLLITSTEVPTKRISKPSILFNPRDAADTSIEDIFEHALYGLEVLEQIDARFGNYKHDLFSDKTRELNRNLIPVDENKRISASISSFLRLLSGHLHKESAFKTLEYLVRKYLIHVFDSEELILSVLPYHETDAFVRIVRLVDFGNTRWKFLDGVKTSGARLTRHVIVQQCLRDIGVLEVICNYATPAKKYQPSTTVISFCTAVVVEVLGEIATVSDDIVKIILPFLLSGLQPGGQGSSEYKAGTLMIVCMMAEKVSLAPKLVSSLVRSIAELAQADAQVSTDGHWAQWSIMALVKIVQLQTVGTLSKKAVDALKEIKGLPNLMSELTIRFNIDRFLMLLLDSLIDYSGSDSCCQLAVFSIIETVSIRGLVQGVAFKLFSSCLRLSQTVDASGSLESGKWFKQILLLLNEKYPDELRAAIHEFLDDRKVQAKGGNCVIEALCKILDGNLESSVAFSESRLWFALEHPKSEIRRAALSNLDVSTILKADVASQRLVNVQNAVGRCLSDDDLTVVEAALSVNELSELVDTTYLCDTLKHLLQRCAGILWSGAAKDHSVACKVAVSCLKHMNSLLQKQKDTLDIIAMSIFPFLLLFPKTKVLNLKAQELAKEIKWPFYRELVTASELKKDLKNAGSEWFSVVNISTACSLANVFSADIENFMPWLVKCCSESQLSKTLSFLVLLQSFVMQKIAPCQSSDWYVACFTFLKSQWRLLERNVDSSCGKEFNSKTLDTDDIDHLENFGENSMENSNAKILVFVFWRSIKAYISSVPANDNVDDEWVGTLRDLYTFFAESNLNHLFKEHRHYLVQNCKVSPIHFLSTFTSDQGASSQVQVESLRSFALLCSQADEASLQLFSDFPLILVPLSSDNQDVRSAAVNYVEELSSLCSRVNFASRNNGNSDSWGSFLGELLSLLVQQKKLILSDRNFLPSFLVSILSPSFQSLLVPQDVGQRFQKSVTEGILSFILGSAMKFSGYAKLKILSLLKELGGSIMRVKDVENLFCELLQRRLTYHCRSDKSNQELSTIELDVLCLLIEICSMPTSLDRRVVEDHLLPALWIDDMKQDDAVLVRPCVIFLQKLNESLYTSVSDEMQRNLFQRLVLLYHHTDIEVQNATREALLRLHVSWATVAHLLESIVVSEIGTGGFSERKKKKSKKHKPDVSLGGHNSLGSLSSLLDVILLKKDMEDRALLVEPLFLLIPKVFSNKEVCAISSGEWVASSSGVSQTIGTTLCYIQQTLLLILEDIIGSLANDSSLLNTALDKFDAALLVDCARAATDVTTRNHVYSLFAAISKVSPVNVLHHVPDILVIIGKSTVSDDDSFSKRVFEEFISTVVPCWLSQMDGADKLLQTFINVMPDIAQHRRLSIVSHLLRTLGESSSLGLLLVLLFRSLVSKERVSSLDYETASPRFKTSVILSEWEYNFAEQICGQYTCMIWLPSLVSMLKKLKGVPEDYELFLTLLFALEFILGKLQNPEFVFILKSMENMETIQGALNELMVEVIYSWQLVDLSKKKVSLPVLLKKDLKELVHSVLLKITKRMLPSAFFQGISRLLVQADNKARKKALCVLCETVRQSDLLKPSKRKGTNISHMGSLIHLDGSDLESFSALCLEILHLLDRSHSDLTISLRLSAISTLEVLAHYYPTNHTVFSNCLACVVRNVSSEDRTVVSCCLRTSGALISVLGPMALPELPQIMKHLLQKTRAVSSLSTDETSSRACSSDSIMLSILVTLEALINNLGAFLSPYLGDIVELLVLHPDYVLESNVKLKSKADGVRRLLSEKVPIRLSLPVMQNVYMKAVESGHMSLASIFELLKNFISHMDKASVSGYHTNIFDFCLLALDLRSRRLSSIKDISYVEKQVINAMVSLTMKMTESMFKPLFIRIIEWAESSMEEDDLTAGRHIRRAVSFYGLVNKLVENHRSLFVPYFKYLLEGSIRYLADDDGKAAHSRKKKKAKLQKAENETYERNEVLSFERWHLRAMVVSSLYKCFLYDAGNGDHKFLDSSRFHVLLKPIVSQLVIEPPAFLEDDPTLPSVKEVDDILVSCLGQMAITAGSDLFWKPLNYEVLMQTRSEMVRTRLLGLKVVKHLVEHLKEEFLVLLAETIPFLAELLEDVELPVKTLAQEILKELESMSGENLREYF